ncbi:UDP-N-acetylglucosamine:LPS N-acetylglucosamine transferase [Paenibacillus darwinianus]|uniref:UDP-N-acetylglucosamine:LPS N-acetylglucosamine transferase n=1 Tax=Paenibacillus darwinianus TaxID=1380763 RepID=A0A9W5W6R8_9BACL|nr:UDP-N-acetylglucosamine--LPS N-acetylglucosamine transferase [Paenibacillus darwinianus]EXX87558.1 UDP-N-acetylglucosamine:LPS N-acetylglucosamine transferase [Paenibacillus darwinianus]EXX87567.1 UDP-N-acetylglucosamine:LPS N-acetylglucosamine transferase [Paenibacillus darwinianus]EXX87700.1 UDP-N-acetylglucosamine:LPS N-acetylglucosamine transferase [Paenibacillus darwinianus]
MRKKRVLLLSEGFGSGHTQAAYALAVGIRQLNPDIQTRVIELGKFLNPVLGPWIVSAYRKTVSKQPRLVGMMYRTNYKRSLNRFTQLALHRIFYTQTSQVITQLKPDLIICTHPVPNAVVARLKRLGLNVPLYTVITDYDAHGTWTNTEVNKYLVSTPVVKRKLIERGIAATRIEVTGIPVHPDFWKTHDKQETQRQFSLKPMPTVLVMGGGWGLLNDDNDLFEYMTETYREQVQMIFCVGSNEKAKENLEANPSFRHPNIRILGFTREVSKLMDASDLLITKPGGMTCTEGLSKGIPMLFYEPIPGQEEENCEYFVQSGFGEMLADEASIDKWFTLIQEPYTTVQYRRTLMTMRNQQYNPEQCSRAVLQMMQ